MPSIPLPILNFVIAGVAFFFAYRLNLGNRWAMILLRSFLALYALASLLLGLRFVYGIETLVPLQRVLPLLFGPLTYLGFLAFFVPSERMLRSVVLHLVGVTLVASALLILLDAGVLYDVLPLISYLIYAALILILWRRGVDAMGFARFEIAEAVRKWMLWDCVLLILMTFLDLAITLSSMTGQRDLAMQLISLGSVLSVGTLAGLVYFILNLRQTVPAHPAPQPSKEDAPTDAVEQQARAFLEETQLYLDPELTVDRLARRMHIPSRALSEAVNGATGMNVSQYVNSFRLKYAADLLKSTSLSVIKIQENSGFMTRSNFYREFQRVYGVSPTQYRNSH